MMPILILNKTLSVCIVGLVVSGVLFLFGRAAPTFPFIFMMFIVAIIIFSQLIMSFGNEERRI